MSKKLYSVVLITVALAVLLGACSMPASRSTRATNTPIGGDLPFAPQATNSDLVNQILSATQTAIAEASNPNQPTAAPTTDGSQSGGGVQATQQPAATQEEAGGGAPQQAAANPTARPIPATPETPSTYTLKKGEFPFCIARRYNVSAGDLLSINGLGVNTQVQPGLTLKIPTSGSWTSGARALKAHPTTYAVGTGDTFYSIACKFGDVHPESIAAANGMNVGDGLSAGATINIP